MKTATAPQLTEQPLEPGFLAFRQRHGLSERALARACGNYETGMTKSTVNRICLGNHKPAQFDRNKHRIQELVTEFLESRNLNPTQIKAELSALFETEEIEMLTNRTELERSAQKFFGLKRDPFALFPRDAEEVFTSKELDNILARVEDAARFQGFVAVVGEIGSGKTVLKARLETLAEESDGEIKLIWPSFFSMDEVNAGSIVIEILRAFDQRIPNNKMDRKRAIISLLKKANDDGVNVAIVIDEAHRLNDKVLSALKNFYEMLGAKFRKFIGLILFGQPQLQGRLREVQFQEIAERLSVVKMPPISKHAEGYLSHRLALAGGNVSLFDARVLDALKRQAKTPLQVGNLANQLLCEAYERKEQTVTYELAVAKCPGLFASDEPKLRATSRQLTAVK
jgi:type II secretory pathway predicted ATPase ExeA